MKMFSNPICFSFKTRLKVFKLVACICKIFGSYMYGVQFDKNTKNVIFITKFK